MVQRVTFIILGPQGSGKGTQVELLAKQFSLTVFAMGVEAKKVRDQDSSLGKLARSYYDRGVLYPENLTKKIIWNAFKTIKIKKGMIFDGFPRTIEQIPLFEKISKRFHLGEPLVIYLKVKPEISLKRLTSRRICLACHKPFRPQEHRVLKVCPRCKSKLIQRPDDTSKAIRKRLSLFQQKTKPVLNYYGKKRQLLEVNGEPSIKEVTKSVMTALAERGIPAP